MVQLGNWWKEGVLYQIYPRSFQDSNGDGIGDLQGIIDRLDYLVWLGVSGLWISPIYASPMHDFGYDISDYRIIDPEFGSEEDVQKLLHDAHDRNIRVIFDMVLNHTSSEHAWFKESSSSLHNPRRDFYIWQEGHGHKRPNNWYAAFGGRAWSLDKRTGQYYLHSFLEQQPDLNWRNEEMVTALFGEMAYWLDIGVDGFRLDVINLIVKDKELRNNPYGWGGRPRPYDMQHHIYDRNQIESHEKLRTFRKWIDTYQDRMLVGEIMVEKPGSPELAASYLGNGTDELHLAFDFSFTWLPWNAQIWKSAAIRWYSAIPEQGWPSWVFSNHDVKRAFSRWKNCSGRARIAAFFLLTQKGTPFLYYGEELGMEDLPVCKGDLRDPVGKKYWPFHKGRDGSRRPMKWDDSPYNGFSSVSPWLPVDTNPVSIVSKQKENRESLLYLYHDLIQMRNHDITLRIGTIRWVELEDAPDVLAYIREEGPTRRLILANFSGKTRRFAALPLQKAMESEMIGVIFSTVAGDFSAEDSLQVLSLQPYQGLICRGE